MVTVSDHSYDICIKGICQSPGCGTAVCNAPGPHFTLPDTNQRLCYNDSQSIPCPSEGEEFYGQDAQYGWDVSNTSEERFGRDTSAIDQPIVIDNVTGLVWQGCTAGLFGDTCASGSVITLNWAAALAYCDSLSWGDYTDWRLPDRYELESIVDAGRVNPAIEMTAFPATLSSSFWSSSSGAYHGTVAWGVNFNNGDVVSYGKDGKGDSTYARCVRGGP
ncbi:MAG: DUF1566 domain-containing protein [Deltaproteobacteria bacterium]|nr:DUF1566 domain-containing protein [Deltaproteobacteria bacterium]